MMLNQPNVISTRSHVLIIVTIFIGLLQDMSSHQTSFGSQLFKEWSSWSSWSACSRSCNEGVQVRTRSCLLSSTERNSVVPQRDTECHGKNVMYKVCKIMVCPEPVALSFSHQCSLHNGKTVRGRLIPFWTVAPSSNGSNPCELNCYTPLHSFTYSFGKVQDGTPCSSNTSRKVCINGRCTMPYHPPFSRASPEFGMLRNSVKHTEHLTTAILQTTGAPPATSPPTPSQKTMATKAQPHPAKKHPDLPTAVQEKSTDIKKTKKKTRRKHKDHRGCPPCSRSGNIQQQFCESDFVLHAVVTNSEKIKNEIRHELKVLRSYKNLVPIQTREYVWLLGTCPCPRMTPRREYLITGKTDKSPVRREMRLVVHRNSYVRRFGQRRALKLLRIQRDKSKLCATGDQSPQNRTRNRLQ